MGQDAVYVALTTIRNNSGPFWGRTEFPLTPTSLPLTGDPDGTGTLEWTPNLETNIVEDRRDSLQAILYGFWRSLRRLCQRWRM
jgi:hypothetical protein